MSRPATIVAPSASAYQRYSAADVRALNLQRAALEDQLRTATTPAQRSPLQVALDVVCGQLACHYRQVAYEETIRVV